MDILTNNSYIPLKSAIYLHCSVNDNKIAISYDLDSFLFIPSNEKAFHSSSVELVTRDR